MDPIENKEAEPADESLPSSESAAADQTPAEHPDNAGYAADAALADDHPSSLLSSSPYYVTKLGAAYLGDSLGFLQALPDASVNLAVTSPPYALHFKKEY